MSKQEKHIKKSLSTKVIPGAILLSLAITLSSCIVGYFQYKTAITKLYNDKGYIVGELILNEIDLDHMESYTQSWEVDDYYRTMTKYMQDVERISKSTYIYMFVPNETDGTIKYIYDNTGLNLGDVEPINPNGSDKLFEVYKTGQRSDSYFVRKSKKYGYLTSSVLPVADSSGHIFAILSVDTNMEIITSTLVAYILKSFAICLVILICFCFAYAAYMQKKVISPIKIIGNEAYVFSQNASKITEGLSEIKTQDELQVLSESILTMEKDIINYVDNLTKVTAEKERIGAELNVATQIQADALPSVFPAFPDRNEFDIYASMNPAKEVGGDFYDFFLIDDDHLGLVMADVSGKGVPAALFMMISKTLLQNQTYFSKSPAEILHIVNNQLCQHNSADMFVTVWLGILELSTGKLLAANAGHEYPAIKKANGEFELYRDKHGLVLAGMEGAKYKEYELTLQKNDVLFVYTDGVPEATNSENVLFGTDRMIEALNKHKDEKIMGLLNNLRVEIDAFVGDAPQFDDITMLALQYFGDDK